MINSLRLTICLVLSVLMALPAAAHAGHEATSYPSFYPHEVAFTELAEDQALSDLAQAKIHAYLSPLTFKPSTNASGLSSITGIKDVLVLRFPAERTRSNPFLIREVRQIVSANLIDREGITKYAFNGDAVPMVTPVLKSSSDYPLISDIVDRFNPHFDPAAAQEKMSAIVSRIDGQMRGGKLMIDGGPVRVTIDGRDTGLSNTARIISAALEKVGFEVTREDNTALHLSLERIRTSPSDFQYYTDYLIGHLSNSTSGRRLMNAMYSSEAERIGLIRSSVESALLDSLEAFVVAELDRYYYNSTRNGVENVAYDLFAGPQTYWFYRTVKLKDFIWNGWLRIGVPALHTSSFNPLDGFKGYDTAVWMAISDPPGWRHPNLGAWYPIRLKWTTENVTNIPAGSWRMNLKEGTLEPLVVPLNGKFSKLAYDVRMSDFHDGERMSAADLLYGLYQKLVSNPSLSDDIVAVRVARDNEVISTLVSGGVVARIFKVSTIELYLRTVPDLQTTLAIAPYSAIPWQVYILAKGSSGPRDLVDDLQFILPELERMRSAAYAPPLLQDLISPEEARSRWSLLSDWASQHRNLLVANGPYYLDRVESKQVILRAFRDFSYPFGIGDYDHLVNPSVPSVQTIARKPIQVGQPVQVNVTLRYSSWPLNNSLLNYLIFSPTGQLILAGAAQRIQGLERIGFTIALTPSQTSGFAPGEYRLKLVTRSPDTGGANATYSTLEVSGRVFAFGANWVDVISYAVAVGAMLVAVAFVIRSRPRKKRGKRRRRLRR